MDIPLKAKPKVETAMSAANFAFKPPLWHASASELSRIPTPQRSRVPSHVSSYKLTRTFSETETQNFDSDTGHRLFRDDTARRRQGRSKSRTASPMRRDAQTAQPKADSTPSSPMSSAPAFGLEDEYIPDLDFSSMVHHWNKPSSEESTPNSRDVSYLDLNKLHAQVAPQPIQFKNPQFRKPTLTLASASEEDPLKKKRKSYSKAQDVNFEQVLASLPSNFNDIPYSQRKKLVKQISDSIDYSQFAQFARNQGSLSSSGRTHGSDSASIANHGSFVRRSRRNSANTVAGRLLAMSSSVDLRRLEPKRDVDEKGAIVMDYQLGRVIGYGAWGIIRECTKDGDVKAVKIVKSVKDSGHSGKLHNPKVLQIFRKEIEIWKSFSHPNILPLLNSLETTETIFCLTNRIAGGTLFEVVSGWGLFNEGLENTSGPLMFDLGSQRTRLRNTAEFVKQIVRALLYLHEELGVVHGDIKLENVLVDDSDPENVQMILCDFGMSRVYDSRVSRGLFRGDNDSDATIRSKSSFASIRRPMEDRSSASATFLDDSKIGIHQLLHSRFGSGQLVESKSHLADFHEYKAKDQNLKSEIDSDLPHSHIGSLPYASPELLSPSPPPLGPSADVWALGVLMYTMLIGKLPFQHPYEPRLRAMIMAGRFDRKELWQAALVEDMFEGHIEASSSLVDLTRKKQIEELRAEWLASDHAEFQWMVEIVEGCMTRDIIRRWGLSDVAAKLHQ